MACGALRGMPGPLARRRRKGSAVRIPRRGAPPPERTPARWQTLHARRASRRAAPRGDPRLRRRCTAKVDETAVFPCADLGRAGPELCTRRKARSTAVPLAALVGRSPRRIFPVVRSRPGAPLPILTAAHASSRSVRRGGMARLGDHRVLSPLPCRGCPAPVSRGRIVPSDTLILGTSAPSFLDASWASFLPSFPFPLTRTARSCRQSARARRPVTRHGWCESLCKPSKEKGACIRRGRRDSPAMRGTCPIGRPADLGSSTSPSPPPRRNRTRMPAGRAGLVSAFHGARRRNLKSVARPRPCTTSP